MNNQFTLSPYHEAKRKLIFDVLERFPDHGNMTLAKKLVVEHPEFFDSIEQARGKIRFYRGQQGETNRKLLQNRKYVKPLRTT